MNNTDNKSESNPYGIIYFNLTNTLHRLKKYSQANFTHYICCRAKCETWEYNDSDIKHMTGIDNRSVKNNCIAFVEAGIFIKSGQTRTGSQKYKLDFDKFESYLKSGIPLKVKQRNYKKGLVTTPNPIIENAKAQRLTGLVTTPNLCLVTTPNLAKAQRLTKIEDITKIEKEDSSKEDLRACLSSQSLQNKPDNVLKLDSNDNVFLLVG